MPRRCTSPPPLVALVAALAAAALGGCDTGSATARTDAATLAETGPSAIGPFSPVDVPTDSGSRADPTAPDAPGSSVDLDDPDDGDGGCRDAPSAPTLDVTARPGVLTFRWGVPASGTRDIRLFEHDADGGGERALDIALDPEARGVGLPVAAHRQSWRTLSWRVEWCGAEGCTSSRRARAVALAAGTFHHVTPPVSVVGERFGERVALNASGSVLAIAAPVEGRIALRFVGPAGPRLADPLPRLDGAASSTRALDVALSASGDTIAVLTGDAARGRRPEAVLLERLGEAWIETARFAAFPSADVPLGRDGARPYVALSADGTRLLTACTGVADCPVSVHELADTGWRARAALDARGTPLAVAASATLGRIVVAVARDGEAPALHVHDAVRDWRAGAPLALPALAADAPVAVALDAAGARVAIGGLEASAAHSPDPVAWRYRIETENGASTLHVEDSLRLVAPTTPALALALATDAALDTIAFGWRTAHDAALVTHVRRDGAWAPALALPDDAGEFAERVFGDALALDADGGALAIGVPSDLVARGAGAADRRSAGRVLLLQGEGAPVTLDVPAPPPTRGPRR